MTANEIEIKQDEFTVFVAIPVFNRIEDTLKCIECLKAQTFSRYKIIVADGGSTDDTPAILKQKHPDVIVLETDEPLWWAGSTRMAIDWALDKSHSSSDFVLMLNNDTLFAPNYLESLIRHSSAHNAAVCGVVVDMADPDKIIDAGVSFHWEGYAFIGRYEVPKNQQINLEQGALPGRGTLIPIQAIRQAGNVDSKHFPHYLADYEFTYRLKRDGGIRLAVAYDISVQTEANIPKAPEPELRTIPEVIFRAKAKFLSRSKQNCIDHLWFIYLHAPGGMKFSLLARIFGANAKFVLQPIVNKLKSNSITAALISVVRFFMRVLRLIFGPYLITTIDIEELELDILELSRHQIIVPSRHEGYYAPGRRRRYLKKNYPSAIPLYRRATNPFRKAYRMVASHGKFFGLSRILTKVEKIIFGPYLIATKDIEELELDEASLKQDKIIIESRFDGYFLPGRRKIYLERNYPNALVLYKRASRPWCKIYRILISRGLLKNSTQHTDENKSNSGDKFGDS